MGNCLEPCLGKAKSACEGRGGGKSSNVLDQQGCHSVRVEDVLLKEPQDVKMMNKDAVVEKTKKAAKRVTFCDEVAICGMDEGKDSKEEVRSRSNSCTGGGCADDGVGGGVRVRIVLTKQEAAVLLPVLRAGGGAKTLEELIGELMISHGSRFAPPCELKDGGEDYWTPALQSIPEDESV